MQYTVKQLATIANISVRALHHYDHIDLFSPAYVGDNQYRYYDESQLVVLQQILFYRDLGLSLGEIKKIITRDDFDTLSALQSHREVLIKELDRHQQLIHTIDKTIAHLNGDIKMKDQEFYYGFDSEKQKQHEKYLVDNDIVSQTMLDEVNEKIKPWTDLQKNEFIKDIERIMSDLVNELERGREPSAESVQTLMQQHYEWLQKTWRADKKSYLGLIDLYQTPAFRSFYDDRHPKLLNFMTQSMKVFSESL